MIRDFIAFWKRYINDTLSFLMTTIGIGALTICLLILFIVVKLSGEVLEKESFAFDKSFLLWLHQFANPTLDQIMLKVTQLGNFNFVIIVVIITLTILWQNYYRQEANTFLIACLGGLILNTGMKLFFAKPRPELWTHLILEGSFSFPSGHASGSIILYGFIAYLLSNHYPKIAKFIYSFAIILIAFIGLSRLYLGVHWPTDIMAGYGVGFLWLIVCITFLKMKKSTSKLIK